MKAYSTTIFGMLAICNWWYSYHIAFKSKEKKWKYEEGNKVASLGVTNKISSNTESESNYHQ